MSAPESNLPPNPPPVPNVPLIRNSPAEPATVSAPVTSRPPEATSPPPMPSLGFGASTPIQQMTQDSVVSTIKDFIKNNVTIGGESAVVSGGRVEFPAPSKMLASESMGISISKPMESVGEATARESNERKTSSDFSQYLGTSASTPMSKEDTIHAIANKLVKDSGGKTDQKTAEAEATKTYEEQQAKNAAAPHSSMSDSDYKKGMARLGDQYRHRGESEEQFRERRSEYSKIQNMTDPEEKKAALETLQMKSMGEKLVPILVTRADGRKKVLVHIKSEMNLDSTTAVPREADEYYDAYTHPFKVIVKRDSTTSTTHMAGVVYYSHLFRSLKPGDTQSITGLLSTPDNSAGTNPSDGPGGTPGTAPSPPQNSASPPSPPSRQASKIQGWVNVSDGDYIILEISVSDGQASAAEIKKVSEIPGDLGAPGSGGYVELEESAPYKQTKARIVLAKITGGFAEQYVTTNLVMRDMCVWGYPVIYPVPY